MAQGLGGTVAQLASLLTHCLASNFLLLVIINDRVKRSTWSYLYIGVGIFETPLHYSIDCKSIKNRKGGGALGFQRFSLPLSSPLSSTSPLL